MSLRLFGKWLVSGSFSFSLGIGFIETAYFLFGATFWTVTICATVDRRALEYTLPVVKLLGCPQDPGLTPACMALSAVYRLSPILGIFHLAIGFCCLLRGKIAKHANEHCWILKSIAAIGMFVGSLYIPNKLFLLIKDLSWIPGCEFLFYQTAGVIEVSYLWARSWNSAYLDGAQQIYWWLGLLTSAILMSFAAFLFFELRITALEVNWLTWALGVGQVACWVLRLLFDTEPTVFHFITSGLISTYVLVIRFQLIWMKSVHTEDVWISATSAMGMSTLTLIYWCFISKGTNMSLFRLICPCLMKRINKSAFLEIEEDSQRIIGRDPIKISRELEIVQKRLDWRKRKLLNLQEQNNKELKQLAIMREQSNIRNLSKRARHLEEYLSGAHRYKDNYYPKFHVLMAAFHLYSGQIGTRWGAMTLDRPTEFPAVTEFILNLHTLFLLGTVALYLLTILNPDFFVQKFRRLLHDENYSSDGSVELMPTSKG